MTLARNALRAALAASALAVLLSGCRGAVTGVNAAPTSPAENRQGMIAWHKQHDKRPVAR